MVQNIERIVDDIVALPLSEVASLVKVLKERLDLPDIPVTAPVTTGAPQSVANGGESEEKKTNFSLMLKNFGDKKTQVIKAVKEIMKKLGKDMTLKDLKDIVESSPVKIAEDLSKDDVESFVKILSDAGADCASE